MQATHVDPSHSALLAILSNVQRKPLGMGLFFGSSFARPGASQLMIPSPIALRAISWPNCPVTTFVVESGHLATSV